ncbi:N-acetylglucosamine-6-phosphate deacetylase [Pseudozobellia thermophila]|uniref:N-acetylglucosamine-6-phosphate deacetylase n=1 Tax=Pseudozobellia thermophila TaxID=192903 RepID=A0A1M6NKN2_9FLAO|nr:N-acetylglucosamine-6-phosphate deacetylase [Pseudozobellia thermophila]SHJ96260.1 N-acetylglucosamine-6-phosphate deacetylase [Pseudozobellia thermophila]
MQKFVIHNGQIITPFRIIPKGTVEVTENKITAIYEGEAKKTDNAILIDAKGQYISPGFIDIHVHGGGGHDFMDGEVEGFLKIAELHAQYGTTAMLPTTLTGGKEDLLNTLEVYEQALKINDKGAEFLGLHLEGPYFAMSQRGAQDPRYIRNPDPAEYREILQKSKHIVRWSAAPELEGAMEFGRYMLKNNVLPAIAHTDAIYEEVVEAVENGYSLSTHLYSGMSGVSRRNAFRYAGVIESSLLMDELDVEIIADGIHLPSPLLKLIYKVKGPHKIALITDAMRAAGKPSGESILGHKKHGLKVIVEDGVAKLPDRSAFAGSVATADRLVRTMVKMGDVPLLDAILMMTNTPARIMGIDHKKGSLSIGKDADIVIFDQNIQIQETIVGGKRVYSAS